MTILGKEYCKTEHNKNNTVGSKKQGDGRTFKVSINIRDVRIYKVHSSLKKL